MKQLIFKQMLSNIIKTLFLFLFFFEILNATDIFSLISIWQNDKIQWY